MRANKSPEILAIITAGTWKGGLGKRNGLVGTAGKESWCREAYDEQARHKPRRNQRMKPQRQRKREEKTPRRRRGCDDGLLRQWERPAGRSVQHPSPGQDLAPDVAHKGRGWLAICTWSGFLFLASETLIPSYYSRRNRRTVTSYF